MQYYEGMLCDYLVEQVEDPRRNSQSPLTRHFLIEALYGNRFTALKEHELQFALSLNWLQKLMRSCLCPDDAQAVLKAHSSGADNADGIEIPNYLSKIFQKSP